ncbi:MAG: MbnP family protein [Candidatus Methylacidiphilales bacterium]
MKLSRCFVLILCTSYIGVFAQKNTCIKLNFKGLINNLALKLDSNYILPNNDTINIETCRFYISNIQLIHQNKTIFFDSTLAHLIDMAEPNSMSIELLVSKNIKYNAIQFNLGIDSALNVSEVLSGDLDPTMGMYWTWQSGYINFKIEGKSKNSPSRYKQFQYHLGGYLYPNYALQTLRFKTSKKPEITFTLEVDKFLNGLDISKVYQIMSPTENSVLLSKKLAQLFKVK